MNLKLILIFFISLPLLCFSQNDSIKITNKYKPKITGSYLTAVDTVVEKILVELALASPAIISSNSVNKLNELEIRKSKTQWLNLLAISTSYNDQTFQKNNPTTPIVYPKYYFSITIPLGIIFSQPLNVKSAREGLVLSKNRQEDFIRTTTADVVGKYRQYRLLDINISMQRELLNDVLVNANQIETNFKKGEVTVETYIASQKIKNEELLKIYDLELQRDIQRLDIEKIIGVPLDEVIKTAQIIQK